MGRKGPVLVPFLQNAMMNKMYRNLISENSTGLIFSIILPHKTKRLQVEDELLFKDWYLLNGKKYVFHSKHYTDAKQAIMASLRKSDYVVKIHISEHKLTYRILSQDEVKEKKRLKKEQKKLNKVQETSNSDDALSSEESGYGSGPGSPQNDQTQVALNENLIIPCNESGYGGKHELPHIDHVQMSPINNLITPSSCESSQMFNTNSLLQDTSSLFGINDALKISGKFDGFFKPEPMDANISAENSLGDPDTSIFSDADLLSNIQPFADNLESAGCFPENMATHCMDSMDCTSEVPELSSSDYALNTLSFESGYDFPRLDSLWDEDNLLLNVDTACNADSSLIYEDKINNQASEIPNEHRLPTEPEDIFDEKLWNKLLESISAMEAAASVGESPEQISSTLDAVLSSQKTETGENIYLCKKCVHLGKIPILFCEPQFKRETTETSGELNIAFDEAVLKEIRGFKSVKEWKFINDHLMVILEPNDD